MAPRLICSASKRAAAWAVPIRRRFPSRQKNASATRWARWERTGNHYLEIQRVTDVYAPETAAAFGIKVSDIVVSIHCGSRGLGHQIGTEFLRQMVLTASGHGLELPDRELACAPINSPLGQDCLGAMRAGINCALANRQVLTHLTRQIFAKILPQAHLPLLYDVSHNTCKVEKHKVDGQFKTSMCTARALPAPSAPAIPICLPSCVMRASRC